MDIENLLRLLNEHRVRFIIIGAAAFPVHGYARATLDFDIFIASDDENVQRTYEALRLFGYDLSDVNLKDMQQTKLLIRQYQLEVDVHPMVAGADFEALWKRRIIGTFGSQPANFPSLDDLIKMKQAAGRAKDKEDLKVLRRLKKELKTKK